MASVIKLKRGTTTPTTGDIVNGEVAIDTSAQKLYINDSSTIKTIGLGNPSLSDLSDSSDVATLTDTQTLTNKTLTSAQVNTDIRLNAQAELEFYDSDSSHYVSFRAPSTVTSSITWTLPASDGTSGQQLTTDGAGNLTFEDAGGAASGSSYPNSTFTTVPGTNGDFDMSFNVAQTVQETPFEASGTDVFGVNLGSVFSFMDPIGTIESIDYGDSEAYVGA